MKRAAIYARVSKAYKKEGEERVTIEEQLADCEAYCQQHGYAIVGRYVDKDKYRVRGRLVNPSAARMDRPEYKRMLKAARAEELDVIVAWKEDRLYRGMYAAVPLAQALDERRNGLTVELVRETFDRSMLGMKAAMGKVEIENIRERMIMGRRARLKRGEVPGGTVRYGYQKDENNRLVVNDQEAEVVHRVFKWYTQGENNMEIRRRLNADDIPPRNSKLWSKATIQNILTFEGYATGEYTTELDGEVFTIPCTPIISMAIWRKAQETREGNKLYRGRNVKEDYLCRGMIVCQCGWKWNARTHFDKKRQYRWSDYYCTRKGHQPELVHPDCPGTIGAQKLDDHVWQFVVTICENPAIVQQAIDARIAQLRAEQGNIEADAQRLQRELDDITEQRQWVITQARKGRITEEDMEMQLVALDFQALNLRTKRDDRIAAIAVQQQAEHLKVWADQYLADIGRGLQALNSDVAELTEEEQARLYSTLEAGRFAEKFDGDRIEALRWAVLEEKRRTVRMLVSEILVVQGENGEKLIIPQLALEIPREYASLAYDDQSLEYIESLAELTLV